MFLLVIDAHSKWMEITVVASATSHSTIEELRKMFATHGLPEVLVSDNGTAFSSAEFHEFTSRNSIRHVRLASYHPSSNGQVERAVQTFKDAMKKESPDSLDTRISRFLFIYNFWNDNCRKYHFQKDEKDQKEGYLQYHEVHYLWVNELESLVVKLIHYHCLNSFGLTKLVINLRLLIYHSIEFSFPFSLLRFTLERSFHWHKWRKFNNRHNSVGQDVNA